MAFKYFPHTSADIAAMLAKTGLNSLDELYADIPASVRLAGGYDLPQAMSETELRQYFEALGSANKKLTVFAGAGVYDHYTPAVIPSIISRSEFLTSYTPYQAEISQGTLHYIFEYQSMIAELTGLDVANASMYDGTTATAEAALMAVASTKKTSRVLISATVDPKTARVARTYAHFHGIGLDTIPEADGVTRKELIAKMIAQGGVAGVIVQQPNRYGIIEDYSGIADTCHSAKALLIVNSVAADLALLKTPKEWGADIAVGDCQSLGMPMNFGGPSVGYMCCTEKLMRKMPGRIVGKTTDSEGKRVFVLTLQAREQHIRRQKATSNICSNQSLMALLVTIYMSLMGREGLKQAASLSYAAAHYLRDALLATGLFTPAFDKPFFNEFCLNYTGDLKALQRHLIDNGILGGVAISDHTLMIAATEKRTKEEIDKFVNCVKEAQP